VYILWQQRWRDSDVSGVSQSKRLKSTEEKPKITRNYSSLEKMKSVTIILPVFFARKLGELRPILGRRLGCVRTLLAQKRKAGCQWIHLLTFIGVPFSIFQNI
jgi:hypothetical protein